MPRWNAWLWALDMPGHDEPGDALASVVGATGIGGGRLRRIEPVMRPSASTATRTSLPPSSGRSADCSSNCVAMILPIPV